MFYKKDLATLKEDIDTKIGQKIIIRGSIGKNKPYEKAAVIEKVYPHIFVVKYEESKNSVTFSYTDVLTKTVEVEVFDGLNYSPLIPIEMQIENQKKRRV